MYKQAFKCCTSKETEQCNECPLREFGETQLDCKTELLKNLKPTKVYEVRVDWANDNAEGCSTEIYSTEEKARKAFNFEIIQAMQDYDGVFDQETGELLLDNWELDKGNDFWEVWEDGYHTSNHCTINLTEKEVL